MGDALAPWHIIILVIVLVLLFGARRLPGAAQSLGQSMHIFKKSVQGLNQDSTGAWVPPSDQPTAANPPEAAAWSPPQAASALTAQPDATQQQLADLQRQVAELQRQSASVSNGQAGQSQTQQPL